MAYIYKITNDINEKIYVGKTERTVEERFKEHCKDYSKPTCEVRPLYRAMNKYGVEHFHIELVEETDNPEEREKYWIEYYGSFKNGYNATLGGDGKSYLDYELIYNTYLKTKNIKETARLCDCCEDSVSQVLSNYKVPQSKIEYNRIVNRKAVVQLDLQENQIQIFPSMSEASRKVTGSEAGKKHISEVCHNKRKTAYGYKWKFLT